MDLYNLISSPYFAPYLNCVRDVLNLSVVSKRFSRFVLSETSGDRALWRPLCIQDYEYDTTIPEEESYKNKYKGFYRWLSAPFSRQEPFNQQSSNSKQTISLVSEFGMGVLLCGFPLYVYPAYWDGSLVRCFVVGEQKLTTERQESVKALTTLLNNGYLDALQSLTSQFASFLDLLVPGRYTIEAIPSTPGQSQDLIFDDHQIFQVYGLENKVYPTQNPASIDPTRVEFYKNQIISGKRPFVLVVSPREASNDKFIVDGHHKALAYQQLNLNPAWIQISLLENEDDLLPELEADLNCDYDAWCANIRLPKASFVEGNWQLTDNELRYIPKDEHQRIKDHFKVFLKKFHSVSN